MARARYDGHAEWYETFSGGEPHERARAFALALLGQGAGRCLDVGTGTGRAIPALLDAGWSVVGVDVSRDQIEVARSRIGSAAELVVADAHSLPFADGEFDAVISFFTHTDFEDPSAVFIEAARVLRPHGTFVYLGVHPCFGSPFIARAAAGAIPDAVALVRTGYRASGWSFAAVSPDGIRARVGINHQPLPDLLNAVLDAGLQITRFYEPNDDDPPLFLALTATRHRRARRSHA